MRAEDITFVFQGGVKSYAVKGDFVVDNLRQVRRLCPGAKIILSTWENADVPFDIRSHVDQLILSKDPGGLPGLKFGDKKPNNANRQIVSTLEGIRAAKTKFVAKVRTDIRLNHCGFLDYFKAAAITGAPILTSSYFTVDPTVFERLPFHLSDWFQFSTRDKLARLWAAPLIELEDAKFYEKNLHLKDANHFERQFRARFAVEQHIAKNYAETLGYCVPEFLNDCRPEVLESYFAFLAKEVLILDPSQISFDFSKYKWVDESLFQQLNVTRHSDWLRLASRESLDETATASIYMDAKRRRRLKNLFGYLFKVFRFSIWIFFSARSAGYIKSIVASAVKSGLLKKDSKQ